MIIKINDNKNVFSSIVCKVNGIVFFFYNNDNKNDNKNVFSSIVCKVNGIVFFFYKYFKRLKRK